MPARLAIGITTYLDISTPFIGRGVYDAYAATAAAIAPNQVSIWSTKHAIANGDDFSRLWRTEMPFKVKDKRGGETVDSGVYEIGAEWRRIGGLTGRGEVAFRGADRTRPDTLIIDHKHSHKIDWRSLFERLIDLTRPAYAMLHLFTDAEVERSQDAERFDRFDGPIAGEEHFVSWKSSLGDWRRPDPWELSDRRRYRFLPELSWANYLGSEFTGEFDANLVQERAARVKLSEHGMLFEVSSDLADVQDRPVEFDQQRLRLREAFRLGFFRTPRLKTV